MNYDTYTLFCMGICIAYPLIVLRGIILDKIEDARKKKLQKERQKAIQNGTWRFRGSSLYFPQSPVSSLPPLDLNNLSKASGKK